MRNRWEVHQDSLSSALPINLPCPPKKKEKSSSSSPSPFWKSFDFGRVSHLTTHFPRVLSWSVGKKTDINILEGMQSHQRITPTWIAGIQQSHNASTTLILSYLREIKWSGNRPIAHSSDTQVSPPLARENKTHNHLNISHITHSWPPWGEDEKKIAHEVYGEED